MDYIYEWVGRLQRRLVIMWLWKAANSPWGGGGGNPYNGLYGEVPPERGQASGIWKGSEICHLGLWKGPKE